MVPEGLKTKVETKLNEFGILANNDESIFNARKVMNVGKISRLLID